MFQSSPTSKGGRYHYFNQGQCDGGGFNPRPPRKVGATPCSSQKYRYLLVSILAHLERWALPIIQQLWPVCSAFQSSPTSKGGRYRWSLNQCGEPPSFNPRPPRKVGATSYAHVAIHNSNVSILAHLERWALRLGNLVLVMVRLFQSSPTSKGGRYATNKSLQSNLQRFNPRPPRKVGATPNY